ncbi:MAG: hypothetical protein ABIR47_15080 [Candidatus Kapaibacterium sp.]
MIDSVAPVRAPVARVADTSLHLKDRQSIDVLEYLKLGLVMRPGDMIFVEPPDPMRRVEHVASSREMIHMAGVLQSGNSYDICIASKPFIRARHRLGYEKTQGNEMAFLTTIDGRKFYGTDGGIPQTELSVIAIRTNGRALSIPRSAYADLYNPNIVEDTISYIEAYESGNGDYLSILMNGSDAAGSYKVQWVFDHHRYVTRLLSTDETLTDAQFDGIADDEWRKYHPE